MIPTVHTLFLLEEMKTDGHSPMKFLCSDNNFYYCKYRTQFKKEELDCLVYELVCQALLENLNIPTPEVAFAYITENSYELKKLKANRRYIKPGVICFASKEAEMTSLITGIQDITGKRDLNEFDHPYDLLKIAIFDLWVDNVDRGRGSAKNYNLLMQTFFQEEDETQRMRFRSRWLAFDHAFCFGGTEKIRVFNATMLPSANGKLLESEYFNSVKKHYEQKMCEQTVDNFISLCTNNVETIINDVFSQIPPEWQIPINLAERMITFLSSSKRIMHIKQLTQHYTFK